MVSYLTDGALQLAHPHRTRIRSSLGLYPADQRELAASATEAPVLWQLQEVELGAESLDL